jgi:hypothetical protein
MLRPRWNFSSRATELSNGDVIILSIPKSGRTWLRTFLSAYFSHKAGRQFSLTITDHRAPEIPRIIYSHDRFEHLTKGRAWDRLRGKYLIPVAQTLRAPIVLLARDPRDAFVSYFVQLTRRNPATPKMVSRMTADALLHHPRFGIVPMVEVMNTWVKEFGGRPDFALVRYEDFRADAPRNFRRLLTTIGIGEIDSAAFDHALKFSDFDNMQQLEASGSFGTKILQPRNSEDPESFKVRRGKVGGFRDYLSTAGQEYSARICATLDHRFGYPVEDGAAK